MRVLIHITNKYDEIRGGYVSPVLQAKHYKKYDTIFVYTQNNVASEIAKKQGLETYIIENKIFTEKEFFKKNLKNVFAYVNHFVRLYKIIKQNDIKVIHVQNFESLILCFWVAKFAKIPLVNHIRSDGNFERLKILIKLSDKIIAVSNTLKTSIESYFKGKDLMAIKNKIFVVENGIEIPKIKDKNSTGTVKLSIIGSIYSVKGQLEFVENVWPLVISNINKDVELNIIGKSADNEYFQKLTNLIHEKKYTNVNLVGLQSDMKKWYDETDITINFSTFEGLPRVVLESMGYGIAVVATDIVGNKDLINHGYNGILIHRNSCQEAASKIIELISNDDLRKSIGDNAREYVTNKYTIQRSSKELELLYDKFICKSK